MLSIQFLKRRRSNSIAAYFAGNTRPNYYVHGGSPPGTWWGKGAELLQLGRTVTEHQLDSLLDGFHPDDPEIKVQNAGSDDRQAGWDLVFALEKSATELAVAGGSTVRRTVLDIDDESIDVVLSLIEERLTFTRRGREGRIVEPAKAVAAQFRHFENRAGDAHFHKHVVWLNFAVRHDGTVGTILSKPFYDNKMALGALYRAEVASRLERDLGLSIERYKDTYRVVGIPDSLRDETSKRRKEIEESLKSKGLHSQRAAGIAALDTRNEKGQVRPLSELVPDWEATAARHGFTQEVAQALIGRAKERDRALELGATLKEGLQALTYAHSHWTEMQLVQQAAIAAIGRGVSASEILEGVKTLLQSQEIVELGHHEGQLYYATREMLELERQMLSSIERRKDETSFVLRPTDVQKLLDAQLPLDKGTDDERQRNADQRKAIEYLALNSGSVAVLSGYAGTGKTFALKQFKQLCEDAGYNVAGVSLAGVAARNLKQETGIESETLAMRLVQISRSVDDRLRHHAKQLIRAALDKSTYEMGRFEVNRRTIIVVDEAAMIPTKLLAQLLDYAHAKGAKIVLAGDERQTPPIEAGCPFRSIAKRFGSYDLSHITRQKLDHEHANPRWARDVVKSLADGDSKRALDLLAERGRVTVSENRNEAIGALVNDWVIEGAKNPSESLILTGTNREAEEINRRCQKERLISLYGDFARAPKPITLQRAESAKNEQGDDPEVRTTLYVGDRIRFTKKCRRLGIENGQRGEVLAIHERKQIVSILTDDGQRVLVPLKKYNHLRLGYASTVHAAQGSTVDYAYLLVGGSMTNRQSAYVQASRGRIANRFYTDRFEAGEELGGLAKQMSLDRSKTLATEIERKSEEKLKRVLERTRAGHQHSHHLE